MIISNLPPLEINKTCSLTGHRDIPPDFDVLKLKNSLKKIADDGYKIFLVGMAKGFDLLCFSALLSLKEENPEIKICAVIPCSDQSKNFGKEDKVLYNDCVARADYVAKEENPYFKNCMLIRDDYLVDNSSCLFAYYDGRRSGGTYYTLNKALKKGLKIIYF